jgi:hypothetical protein
MTVTTGMLMAGKMSAGMRRAMAPPNSRISIAATTKV